MAQTRRRLPVVTFAVALAAIGLAFREWYAFDPEPLRMSYRAFAEQPWRLVSPVLLHADILPLILSVYWLVAFGAPVEARWGRALDQQNTLLVSPSDERAAVRHEIR